MLARRFSAAGIFLLLAGIVLLIAAANAGACFLTTLTLTPESGPPGTGVTADSMGGLPDAAYTIKWDGAAVASGMTDSGGNGSVDFNVPSDATVGDHQVEYEDIDGVKCSAIFTVTEMPVDTTSVQSNAYVSTQTVTQGTAAGATSLPATGLTLLVPVAAGLAAAGAGLMRLTRRR